MAKFRPICPIALLAAAVAPGSLPVMLAGAADCECPTPWDADEKSSFVDRPFFPKDESNLGSASEVCDNHSDEDSWFNPTFFDPDMDFAVIKYRYCARPWKRFISDQSCDSGNSYVSDTYSIIKDVYDNDPTCSEYYTKNIPEDVNFRVFHGYETEVERTGRGDTACRGKGSSPDSCYYDTWDVTFDSAVLAYSSQGTVCFRGHVVNGVCSTEYECSYTLFCERNSSRCRQTQCVSREAPGAQANLVMRKLDDGRNMFWVEMEIDPVVADAPVEPDKDKTDPPATGESVSPGEGGDGEEDGGKGGGDDCEELLGTLCETGGEDSTFFELYKSECGGESIDCSNVLTSPACPLGCRWTAYLAAIVSLAAVIL